MSTDWRELLDRLLDGGTLTDAEAQALSNALERDGGEEGAAEWLRFAEAMSTTLPIAATEKIQKARERLVAMSVLRERKDAARRAAHRRRVAWVAGLAAAVLAAAGVWFFLGKRYPDPQLAGDYHVEEGTVVAGPKGAQVNLGGYCDLTLDPGTRIVLRGKPGSESIEIEQGSVRSKITPGRGGFSVQTPLGALKVLGTEFTTSVTRETAPAPKDTVDVQKTVKPVPAPVAQKKSTLELAVIDNRYRVGDRRPRYDEEGVQRLFKDLAENGPAVPGDFPRSEWWVEVGGEMPDEAIVGEHAGRQYVFLQQGDGSALTRAVKEGTSRYFGPQWGLAKVSVERDARGRPAVACDLIEETADRFARIVKDNVGLSLAVVVDGRVINAPRIEDGASSRMIIEGDFTEEQAREMADALRAGMPAVAELKRFVEKRDFEHVKYLLDQNPALANTPDMLNKTCAMHVAAWMPNGKDMMEFLLARGADVNGRGSASSPLHIAVAHSRSENVKVLLARGADVNALNEEGQTPLHHASIAAGEPVKDFEEIATALLDAGADINAKGKLGLTPLAMATIMEGYNTRPDAAASRARCVEFLIGKGARQEVFSAAALGKTDELGQILLGDPAAARLEAFQGITPLHVAALRGETGSAKLLLDAGANPNAACKIIGMPLHAGAFKGHDDVVKLLLARGADVKAAGPDDGGLAIHAAAIGGSVEVVKTLLAAGMQVDARAEQGGTPLLSASSHGRLQVVKLLLARGADIRAAGRDGRTVLHRIVTGMGEAIPPSEARDREYLDTLDTLVAAGADVNARDAQKATPLCGAAGMRDYWHGRSPLRAPMTRALIKHGADVNARDEHGYAPLYHSIRRFGSTAKDDPDVALALIEAGADPLFESLPDDIGGRSERPIDLLRADPKDPVYVAMMKKAAPRIAAEEKAVRAAFQSFLDAVEANRPDVVKAALVERLEEGHGHAWQAALAEKMHGDYALEPERLREIVDVKARSGWAVATIRRPGAEKEKYMLFALLRRPDGRWGIFDFTETSRDDIEAHLNSYATTYRDERKKLYDAARAAPAGRNPGRTLGGQGYIIGNTAPATPDPEETRRTETAVRFGIYLVKEPKTTIEAEKAPLGELVLSETPVIGEEDVLWYDWDTHLMTLKPRLKDQLNKQIGQSAPFVLVADGRRCYLGTFSKSNSSYVSGVPVCHTDETSSREGIPPDAVLIDPAPQRELRGKDPRGDDRVRRALQAAGKLTPPPEALASLTSLALDHQLREAVAQAYGNNLTEEERLAHLDQMERTCLALLERYNRPEEQGKIYGALGKTFSQTGLLNPRKAAEYDEKAIGFLSDPYERGYFYIWWGCAIQVAHAGARGDDLAAARREAVAPHLTGLSEVLLFDLPEKKPDLPRLRSADIESYMHAPHDSEEYREARRKFKEYEKESMARGLTRFQEDMMSHRDAFLGQISTLYSTPPFATDELKRLATEALGDSPMVDQLTSRASAAIEKQTGKPDPTAPKPDASTSAPPDDAQRLVKAAASARVTGDFALDKDIEARVQLEHKPGPLTPGRRAAWTTSVRFERKGDRLVANVMLGFALWPKGRYVLTVELDDARGYPLDAGMHRFEAPFETMPGGRDWEDRVAQVPLARWGGRGSAKQFRLVLAALPPAPTKDAPTRVELLTADTQRRAAALVAQFSDPTFAVRQKAVDELVKMGPNVLPLVRKTLAETADAEVKMRCEMVIKALGGKPEAALSEGRHSGAKDKLAKPSTRPVVVEVSVLSGVVAFSFGGETGKLAAGESRTFPAAPAQVEETKPAGEPVKTTAGIADPDVVPEPDEEKLTADEVFARAWASKDRNEQVRLYTRVIELAPDRAAAWQNRGFAHLCLNQSDLAIADFNKCIELDPKNAYAYNNRGQLMLDRGLLDDALKDLNKAIECEPGLAYPYNHRGRLYTRQGKYDLAVENFSKAIGLLGDRDDEWLQVHLGRAKANYRLKEFDKAWADVKFCREKKIKVPDDFLHDLEDASGKFDGE